MSGYELIVFVAVVVCSFGVTSYVLPAGKCNTHGFQVKPVNYPREASISDWNIIYGTNVEPLCRIDHYLVRVTYNGDMTSREDSTIVFKNSTVRTNVAKQTYVYNFLTEDSISEQAKYNHFHIFPLAILEDHSTIYYRCSEIGGLPVDTRYITVPKGMTLTRQSRDKLLEIDRTYNFTGDFIKFPYELYSEA